MKIALIGYGKMGKAIEKIALDRGHRTPLLIDSKNPLSKNIEHLKEVDVAIEFSRPDNVIENIYTCLDNSVPIVVGTTGWNDMLGEITEKCNEVNGQLLHASNFSIGVNLFFDLNKKMAQMMKPFLDEYKISMEEIHHTQKLDAPSGTAITLAQDIIGNTSYSTYSCNENEEPLTELNGEDISIHAKRIPEVPGTHSIKYESSIDKIEICHTAKNRTGFALGAVIAAEWIVNKHGVYTMSDVLDL